MATRHGGGTVIGLATTSASVSEGPQWRCMSDNSFARVTTEVVITGLPGFTKVETRFQQIQNSLWTVVKVPAEFRFLTEFVARGCLNLTTKVALSERQKSVRENQRISMRTSLEVLNSFDLIITCTSDIECVNV